MFKNILIAVLLVALIISFGMCYVDTAQVKVNTDAYNCMDKDLPREVELECRHVRYFMRPYMKDGCVYQESQGRVIKTCG